MVHHGARQVKKVRTVGRICAAVMAKESQEEEEWPWPPGFLPLWDRMEEALFDA